MFCVFCVRFFHSKVGAGHLLCVFCLVKFYKQSGC